MTIFAFVLLTGVFVATAQQPPATLPPVLPSTPMPTIATAVPPEVVNNTPRTTLSIEETEALPTLLNARNDLELLASHVLGADQRPIGWNGSADAGDPQLPILIRLDLELLASAVMNAEPRPADWFGVVVSVPMAIARDIRHDLELLADHAIGGATVRPGGWIGDDPVMRCTRTTQALLALLERSGFALTIDFTQPDYCKQIEQQTTAFVESTIIQPILSDPDAIGAAAFNALQPYRVETNFVVAFLDRNARERAGVLPHGVGFVPVARSSVDFSNMMLVEGSGFRVFVDYSTTPVSREAFLALPSVDAVAGDLECIADWCVG